MKFKIFYKDKTVEGDTDDLVEISFKVPKAWVEAPIDGIQAIIYGKNHCNAADFYYWLEDRFFSTNDLNCSLRTFFKGLIKFGSMLPDGESEKVTKLAKEHNWNIYQEIIKPNVKKMD
jgi:hypothetical protein